MTPEQIRNEWDDDDEAQPSTFPARQGTHSAEQGSQVAGEGSKAQEAREGSGARVARYAEAIWNASRADEGTISATGANIVARAVVAVADAELAEARAEVERLREFHRDVSAAVLPFEPTPGTVTVAERITTLGRGKKVADEQRGHFAREAKIARDGRDWWRASALDWKARAEAAEAQLRDVEALAERMKRGPGRVTWRDLRAVLVRSQAPQAPAEEEGAPRVERFGGRVVYDLPAPSVRPAMADDEGVR